MLIQKILAGSVLFVASGSVGLSLWSQFGPLTSPISAVQDTLTGNKADVLAQLPVPETVQTTPPVSSSAQTSVTSKKNTTESTSKSKTASTTASSAPSSAPTKPPAPPSHRGVTIRAFALEPAGSAYSPDHLATQMDFAKELGSTDIRANAEQDYRVNDDYVNFARARGMSPSLILEPVYKDFFAQATYQSGYDYAKPIVERYIGKVSYYQLGNEASGVAIRPNFPGWQKSDFDDAKYAVLKEFLRGLSDGVHDADPNAKRMITAHWVGTGIFDRLVEDGINFEMIGWDWYSDMGIDMIKKIDTGILNIPQYLSKYNKEFWVVELNRQNGTLDGNENAQADFLESFIDNTSRHGLTKGIMVFILTDMCSSLNTGDGKMGLIDVKKNGDGSCYVAGKKPAYFKVQEMFTR